MPDVRAGSFTFSEVKSASECCVINVVFSVGSSPFDSSDVTCRDVLIAGTDEAKSLCFRLQSIKYCQFRFEISLRVKKNPGNLVLVRLKIVQDRD